MITVLCLLSVELCRDRESCYTDTAVTAAVTRDFNGLAPIYFIIILGYRIHSAILEVFMRLSTEHRTSLRAAIDTLLLAVPVARRLQISGAIAVINAFIPPISLSSGRSSSPARRRETEIFVVRRISMDASGGLPYEVEIVGWPNLVRETGYKEGYLRNLFSRFHNSLQLPAHAIFPEGLVLIRSGRYAPEVDTSSRSRLAQLAGQRNPLWDKPPPRLQNAA